MPSSVISAGLVVMWSSGFIGAELGTRQAGAPTLLMWRFVAASLLFGGAWLLLRRRRRGRGHGHGHGHGQAHGHRLPRRALAEQSAIGLLSQGVYLGSVVWAADLGVPSGTSALIAALQPLAAGSLAGRLLGERVTRRQWAGLLVGLLGVALVVRGDLGAPGTAAPPWAYALPFAGMAGLLAASFLERRARHQLSAADTLPLHCVVSAVVFTGAAALLGQAAPPATSSFWLAVGWVVVLSTLGGYGFYWLSLRRSGVTRTSALIYLTPPTTVLWAYAMFGDAPGAAALVGMAICVAGVLTATAASASTATTTSTSTSTAKEPQSRAGRYHVHDRNDSRLQPSAVRAPGGSGCDRARET